MSQLGNTIADQILRLVEINRTTINGLMYGDVIFRVHQGKIVEIVASETLKLSVGTQLCPLRLKADPKDSLTQ